MESDRTPWMNGYRLERKYKRVRRAFGTASWIAGVLMAVVAYLLWYRGCGV
jgi:hypothetical protein